MRRNKWQGHIEQSRWRGRIGQGQRRLHLAGHRQPLRLRLRKSQYWRSLPGLRGPLAVAMAVAQQVFRQATAPGSDAPCLVGPRIPERARTGATTKPTSSARRPVIFSLGNPWKSIGIAPAWRSRSRKNRITDFRPRKAPILTRLFLPLLNNSTVEIAFG